MIPERKKSLKIWQLWCILFSLENALVWIALVLFWLCKLSLILCPGYVTMSSAKFCVFLDKWFFLSLVWPVPLAQVWIGSLRIKTQLWKNKNKKNKIYFSDHKKNSKFNISHKLGLKITESLPFNPTYWGLSNTRKSRPHFPKNI